MPTTAIMIDALIAMRHEKSGVPEEHFWQLVERFRADLVNQAFSILGNQADAEDCAQTALAKAFRMLASLKEPQRLGAWMRTINHRTALNLLRSKKRNSVRTTGTGEIDTGVSAPLTTPTGRDIEAVSRNVSIEQVSRAVDELPEVYREVIVLRYWEHLNLEQAAQRLGVPLGTIKSRLARADRMLVEKLRRIWSEDAAL